MSPLNFIINNFIFVVFVAIGSVLLRLLAVRPWQIRFRGKQAELAGLQSQVNPHFLFNALNTLYASAIIENAERTSGGIQKLSDMMRFMLHENNKTQIDIRQEVNYLKNYIDLQQLRTSGIKDFELKTDLDDTLCLQSIVPMLLVPFVENAFKHGISMRQKSWIDIKLRCDGQQLYFAVFNSFHPKSDQDPERNASGIGLENVKKRLQLLYPKKHQLSIHQTEREFSINLTVKLK
jgi:LytS/YehU family sensor histidine kinase